MIRLHTRGALALSIGRLSVEHVPLKVWRVGRFVYASSTVVALGPVQVRWRRRCSKS
jgi:hypothetical protein